MKLDFRTKKALLFLAIGLLSSCFNRLGESRLCKEIEDEDQIVLKNGMYHDLRTGALADGNYCAHWDGMKGQLMEYYVAYENGVPVGEYGIRDADTTYSRGVYLYDKALIERISILTDCDLVTIDNYSVNGIETLYINLVKPSKTDDETLEEISKITSNTLSSKQFCQNNKHGNLRYHVAKSRYFHFELT